MVEAQTRLRYLRLLLRIGGGVLVTAFPAMLLPVDWMAATHEWLGLGEFPRRPLVDYLTRSVAALYGFHGVLLLIVSIDPLKYRTIVVYFAVMNVMLGSMLTAIGLHAGLPAYWTLAEGPSLMATGLAIGLLVSGFREEPYR